MKLGVFGGSFNPPHMMHRELVMKLLEKKIVDKIIMIPTSTAYPKSGLIPAHHRVHMLELMFQDMKQVMVSDYERQKEVTYTYQTLDYFQKQYPDATIYFICGSDNFREFYWWKEHDYMLEHYHFIIIPRNHDNIEELKSFYPKYQDHFHFVPLQLKDGSSTLIRNKLAENCDMEILNIIDSNVYEYIKEKNFYRKQDSYGR